MVTPIGDVLNSNSYSSSKEPKNTVTVSVSDVITNLSDLISPEDPYMRFYIKQYRVLGYTRYMEFANKARAGGRDAPRLFFWMLKNPDLVR